MGNKNISAKLPEAEHLQNRQLDLFQKFLCNNEDERQKLSNAIELWDVVPRYSISRIEMTKMRNSSGHLDLLKRDFDHRGIRYNIQIQAALVEEKINNGGVKAIAYYPSANEELVEEALRKLAVDQGHGFYEKEKGHSGVVFSLFQLRKELRRSGHARSFSEIKLSLDILSGSSIQIVANMAQGKAFAKCNYLPLVAGVTRRDLESEPNARWLVQFHPLVTESIDKFFYRQFNYEQLMSYKTQLARWLHRLLIIKYTFASKIKTFEIRYSTIKRDSAMLDNYSRDRAAQEACDYSLNELVGDHVISSVKRRVETGIRRKVMDIVYTLTPSMGFIAEVKAANKRRDPVGMGGGFAHFSVGIGGGSREV